jgi:hypothetical protein
MSDYDKSYLTVLLDLLQKYGAEQSTISHYQKLKDLELPKRRRKKTSRLSVK